MFFLILAAVCNFEAQIPVCQNQRSRVEREHSLPKLLHPWPGQQLCPQPGLTSGMGSRLWTRALSQVATNLCPQPLAEPWRFLQRISEVVSSVGKVQQLCPGSRGSPNASPCCTVRQWLCYLDSQRQQKWILSCLWESLTLSGPWQILRDQFKELWDLLFLHFIASRYHHQLIYKWPVNILLRHFPDLSGSFVLEIKLFCNWF